MPLRAAFIRRMTHGMSPSHFLTRAPLAIGAALLISLTHCSEEKPKPNPSPSQAAANPPPPPPPMPPAAPANPTPPAPATPAKIRIHWTDVLMHKEIKYHNADYEGNGQFL